MDKQTDVPRKAGRPTKAPEGKRVVVHVSLSPAAVEKLRALCDRPITPIDRSAMLEHLVMTAETPGC